MDHAHLVEALVLVEPDVPDGVAIQLKSCGVHELAGACVAAHSAAPGLGAGDSPVTHSTGATGATGAVGAVSRLGVPPHFV